MAYVHDVGHGEHAKYAAAFLLEQLKLQKIAKGRLVDLGCGSGILASAMSERGYDVIGVDYSENRKAKTLVRNIWLFRKINDVYRKSKEVHRLQLYERTEIKRLLKKVGFIVTVLENYKGLQFREKHVGFLATKGSVKKVRGNY